MKPDLNDIRYDPILSNVSVAYKNEAYVAEQILPAIPTKTRTGKYFIYDKSKFRLTQSLRSMGSPANEIDYGLTKSAAYVCKDHALKEVVPDELKKQAPSPLNPELDATENITERLLIEKEYDLATYMSNTANLTNNTTLSGTSQWSDYADSDPIGDVKAAKSAIHAKIFHEPNVLLLGKQVYDKLLDHPDIIDRIKYGGGQVATDVILARLFGVDKVIVGAAGYNTATEGQADSMAYIWGKNAWLLYVPPKPGIRQIAFGYHFQYQTRKVDKWYDKDREGIWIRVHDNYTREIIAVDAAYLIKDAIA